MIDSLTAFLLAALLFAVLSLMLALITAGQRNVAVAWWCMGSVFAALGIVLVGVHPWIPRWLSFTTASASLVAGYLFWAQSLRSVQGRPWALRRIVGSIVLFALCYGMLYSEFQPKMSAMAVRASLGFLSLLIALQAWRLSHALTSHNATAIGVCYGIMGLGLWAQTLSIAFRHADHVPNLFDDTWYANGIALVALVIAVGGHLCFAGMVLDASKHERLRAAREQAAAEETARLEALLQLHDRQTRMVLVSGSLAHELSQPLTAALLQAQVAQRHLRSGVVQHGLMVELLERMLVGLQRTSAILDRIRSATQASDQPHAHQRLDLRTVVRTSSDMLQAYWASLGVRVKVSMGSVPLMCNGDEVALSQVLMNLLRNATQAVERGEQRLLHVHGRAEANQVHVVVRDHGAGVADEVLEGWGAPFISTRKHYAGLGLGLAISLAIVRQHRGSLSLRNHPEGGTEAVLSLPGAPEVPA